MGPGSHMGLLCIVMVLQKWLRETVDGEVSMLRKAPEEFITYVHETQSPELERTLPSTCPG